ncbi:MAG: L,D-transpeptidase family protein [Proteobacteria bacterium]|nr:L,D-transpeptidase family protein [Pseudomonadota bacterium]MBU1058799.1 L,D-transpeptidase family protein [Pseudomonadota bacterium]
MRKKSIISLFVMLSLFFAVVSPMRSQADPVKDGSDIRRALSGPEVKAWALQNVVKMQSFYQARGYHKAWTPGLLTSLVTAINTSTTHGFTPCDYRVTLLQDNNIDPLRRELLATDAYLTLAGHLLSGKVNPVSIEPGWNEAGRKNDLVAYLEKALARGDIEESLEALAPTYPEYEELQRALARYRQIANHGGWGQIDSGRLMKRGSHGERVIQLRQRLKAGGDLEMDSDPDPAEYTTAVEEAVKRFQQQVNLETDGMLGPNTMRNLNMTPEDRIAALRINMERWRWLPEDLGVRHIRVNIAGFFLEAYDHGILARQHKVIVGMDYRQTPVFSDAIEYLILNPWWYAPRKLAVKDKLPMFHKDPKYFGKGGFQLLGKDGKQVDERSIQWWRLSENNFPYQLRQKPGPKNALGRVKFIFPNKYNIYLHDTPSTELFAKVQRVFSSGCIRVENPLELAEWLLASQEGWSREKIQQVVDSGRETRVNLAVPMPVHLLYWTVLSDSENNDVRFIDDQYQRDSQILVALDTICPAGQAAGGR